MPSKWPLKHMFKENGEAGRNPPTSSFHWSSEEASNLFKITQQVSGQDARHWPGPSWVRARTQPQAWGAAGPVRRRPTGKVSWGEICLQAPEPTPSLLPSPDPDICRPQTCCCRLRLLIPACILPARNDRPPPLQSHLVYFYFSLLLEMHVHFQKCPPPLSSTLPLPQGPLLWDTGHSALTRPPSSGPI